MFRAIFLIILIIGILAWYDLSYGIPPFSELYELVRGWFKFETTVEN